LKEVSQTGGKGKTVGTATGLLLEEALGKGTNCLEREFEARHQVSGRIMMTEKVTAKSRNHKERK